MSEFEIKGQSYNSGKLDAFKQMHITRRLLPMIGRVGPGLMSADGGSESMTMASLAPVADALAHMSDEDCDYVVQTCLAVVKRRQGEGAASVWSIIWNKSANRLMFDDIDMAIMLQITTVVIKENLTGFFSELPSTSPGASVPSPAASNGSAYQGERIG